MTCLLQSPYRGDFVAKSLDDYFLQIAKAPDDCFLQGDCFSRFANSPDDYCLEVQILEVSFCQQDQVVKLRLALSPFGSGLWSSQQQFGGSATVVWKVLRMDLQQIQFYCLMSVDESLGLDDTAHLERMMFGMVSRGAVS
jgi:hypothetical protein